MSIHDDVTRSNPTPPLPAEVTTSDGVVFDPHLARWQIGGLTSSQTMKFDEFDRLTTNIVLRLKWVMLLRLQEVSFAHAKNLLSGFVTFYRSVFLKSNSLCESIELSHILTFKALLDETTEWKLGILRNLLSDMDRLGFGISSTEVIEYLATSHPVNLLRKSLWKNRPHKARLKTEDSPENCNRCCAPTLSAIA